MRMGAVVDRSIMARSWSGSIRVVAPWRHDADLRRCCNYRLVKIRWHRVAENQGSQQQYQGSDAGETQSNVIHLSDTVT